MVSFSSRLRLSQLSRTTTRRRLLAVQVYLAIPLAKSNGLDCSWDSRSAMRTRYSGESGGRRDSAPFLRALSSIPKIFSRIGRSSKSISGKRTRSSCTIVLAVHSYAWSIESGASLRLSRTQTVLSRNSGGRATRDRWSTNVDLPAPTLPTSRTIWFSSLFRSRNAAVSSRGSALFSSAFILAAVGATALRIKRSIGST